MILVTGATGNFGKSTIDFLLEKGISSNHIAALVRDEEKAHDLKSKGVQLRIADYQQYDQLVAAFNGIEKLLLISSSDIVNRSKQHENVINAAKEAGVKHLYYTSFERKNETSSSPINFVAESHIATENWIKKSGLNYTIFRNNLYLDVLPWFFGENVVQSGVFLPAGETKAAFTLREDMAEATANVLITEGHQNKVYAFSNTENVSVRELAHHLSDITGKSVPYTNPTATVYINTLTNAGVPVEFVNMFAGFSEAIQQGEFETNVTDLERILGRKPTSAKDYLKSIYTV
jgi:NAD(P)H dehydrogenase (quinone)